MSWLWIKSWAKWKLRQWSVKRMERVVETIMKEGEGEKIKCWEINHLDLTGWPLCCSGLWVRRAADTRENQRSVEHGANYTVTHQSSDITWQHGACTMRSTRHDQTGHTVGVTAQPQWENLLSLSFFFFQLDINDQRITPSAVFVFIFKFQAWTVTDNMALRGRWCCPHIRDPSTW